MLQLLRQWYKRSRLITARWRVKPDFLIIGAQKSGTSSLYVLLKRHPQVIMPRTKEIHFFDYDYEKGENFYRQHFATGIGKKISLWLKGQCVTGEASPSYIINPDVPARVYRYNPHVKLIVILRDPISRAVSQYKHNMRLGREPRSIEAAFKDSAKGMREQFPLLPESQLPYHYNYLARGLYFQQLERWEHFFSRDQILILDFDELQYNPSKMMDRVFSFLEIRKVPFVEFPQANKGMRVDRELNWSDDLTAFFRQDVKQLRENWKLHFSWMDKYLDA